MLTAARFMRSRYTVRPSSEQQRPMRDAMKHEAHRIGYVKVVSYDAPA